MIEISNLSFSYNESLSNELKDISLSIKKGECVLLCGESGCGKTTLTRLMNGLIPHFFEGELSGILTINGKDTAKTSIAELSDIVGTVFQNPRTQFFNTDTDSEIVFGLENRAFTRAQLKNRLNEVLKELNIEKLRNRNIFELSGGEKQKIAFASVYASNPELFILDEPSSNLDMTSVLELKELIKKIKAQGKTIVIAEHRLWYLTDVADRVIVMKRGQIIKDMPIKTFQSISSSDIEAMGLRCRSFSEIKSSIKNISSNKSEPKYKAEIKELSVKYKNHTILSNISFTADSGEIIAITGENGAGKSTLARTVCGLVKETTGSISINGAQHSWKTRRRLSYMVMQDVGHQLFTDSVMAECRLGTRTQGETLINEVLSILSLTDFKDRHPLSLSGGQKQRLAVAISMLCDKEILIFDEPTSGLDLKSMREVGYIIESLSKKDKLILVITHDVELIKTVCSRALILSKGQLIADLRNKEKEEIERYIIGGR